MPSMLWFMAIASAFAVAPPALRASAPLSCVPASPHCSQPLHARNCCRSSPALLLAASGEPSGAADAKPPAGGYFRPPLVTFIVAIGVTLIAVIRSLKLPVLTLTQLGGSHVVPAAVLLGLRAIYAAVIAISLRASLFDPKPHVFAMLTYPGTRLPQRSVPFKGLERLTTFTVQCWALQLIYFLLATTHSALHLAGVGSAVPAFLATATHILFEVSLATSILVTSVVTFVLLPERIKREDWAGARRMLGWRPQLMHNANLAFTSSELLLNSLPMLASHYVFAAAFGVLCTSLLLPPCWPHCWPPCWPHCWPHLSLRLIAGLSTRLSTLHRAHAHPLLCSIVALRAQTYSSPGGG